MQRFITAAVASLVLAACGKGPMGPEELLVGTWRERSIDFSGMKTAFVAYYVDRGATQTAATTLADQLFSEFPYGAINGGSTITIEKSGRWTDSSGDAGTWIVEGDNTLIIVSESGAGARKEASYTVEGDILTLFFNKAQYLNLIRDAQDLDGEGVEAYEFFRSALPETGTIVKVGYERVK